MMASAGVEELIVGGGRSVYHAYMAAGMADDVVLDVQPVAFGAGVPLFGEALTPTMLRLKDKSAISGDALRLCYEVVRTP
jgi:dihydrofolate reductase